jgi:hypothetical protein
MEENAAVQETHAEPKLSFITKLGLIFTSPSKVFKNLAIYPAWLAPTLLILVFSLISGYLMRDLGMQAQKDRIIRSERIPEDRKELILDRMEEQSGSPMQVVMMVVGVVVFIFASYAVVAALFLFTGNVILGGSANFKQMLSVYAWGSLVGIPEAIIKIPLALAKNSIHVYSSLAILFDTSEADTTLFKIANAVDIFALWRVALWAIGFGIVYKFSQGKSYAAIISWYVIWIIVSIAFSSLFAGFLG